MNKNIYFRMIPKMDDILNFSPIQQLCTSLGRGTVMDGVRLELENLRSLIASGTEEEIDTALHVFMEELPDRITHNTALSLKKVINATGILLHTNLGRAPLGQFQVDAALQAMTGYSNLEYDLSEGKRGKRSAHYASLISKILGCEHAIAVNNNAAAVTLMLSALAKGKEVLVSRGELIEIGGRFRIPDVMEQSGAALREVGTTNRTRISDYEKAITENTGAILKVHTSNYKIVGFTEEASVEELAALGKKYHLPVLVDLGSGVLMDLEKLGLSHEPTVQETLKKGTDVVCFSGDKLLGGPQAGILAGKKACLLPMEEHPLIRAFRLDKCTAAVLSATFRAYQDETFALRNIPILHMLSRPLSELESQADALALALQSGDFPALMQAEPSINKMGGGALPGEEIPGFALTLIPTQMACEEMAKKMRQMSIPVICHIKNSRIWLEMRTVSEEEANTLAQILLQNFI